MRILSRSLAAGVTGALSVMLLVPPEGTAFTTLGFALGVPQRDFRVFDNFADFEANDNTTPHPNWPGYTGAELAVWKAVAEWGSTLHGDGTGDPSQPGDLGSGGSNFDSTWQGNAPDAGSSSDNVVSAIPSLAGGVRAATEMGPNGWRILLNDAYLWDDGPGTSLVPGALDIQGIVAHHYGHALGLGHSTVAGATMYANSTGNGVAERSIHADDIAGMQFLYGSPSALKPRIVSAAGGNPVVIDGKFSPTDNEVWFTRAGGNPTGEPIKVTGVASTPTLNGNRISIAHPLGAGPGDVLVLDASGQLSNAFPFKTVGCALPELYCTAGISASGCQAQMSWSGTPSATTPVGFVVTATGAEGQKSGLFYFGSNGRQANPWGNGTSFQCVVPPVKRTPVTSSLGTAGQCDGLFQYDLNVHWNSFKPQTNPGVGAVVQIQNWYRDPGNTSNQTTSLSNALEVTVCP